MITFARMIQLFNTGAVATKMMSDTMENADKIGLDSVKPITWGMILWAGGAFVFMPMIGKERFKKNSILSTYLAGHIVYGAVFGALAKEKR